MIEFLGRLQKFLQWVPLPCPSDWLSDVTARVVAQSSLLWAPITRDLQPYAQGTSPDWSANKVIADHPYSCRGRCVSVGHQSHSILPYVLQHAGILPVISCIKRGPRICLVVAFLKLIYSIICKVSRSISFAILLTLQAVVLTIV